MRDLPVRRKIKSGEIPAHIEAGQQRKHTPGTLEYRQYVEKLKRMGQYGPRRVTIPIADIEEIVGNVKGTGILKGGYVGPDWVGAETITTNDRAIGVVVNNQNGAKQKHPCLRSITARGVFM